MPEILPAQTFKLPENPCYSPLGVPVAGSRKSSPSRRWLKSNNCVMEFAIPSNDPCPMRVPPSQLSSMKWMIELWSVTV